MSCHVTLFTVVVVNLSVASHQEQKQEQCENSNEPYYQTAKSYIEDDIFYISKFCIN